MKYRSSFLFFLALAMSVIITACGGGGSGGGGGGTVAVGLTVHEGSTSGTIISNGSAASGQRQFGSRDITSGPSSALLIAVVNNSTTVAKPATMPTISGTGSSHFSLSTTGFLTTVPANTGLGSNSSGFSITFNPSATGSHTATVSMTIDGTAFSFGVSGAGVSPSAPGISINDVSMAEGDSGTSTMTFTVSITPTPTSNISVDWATADSTATVSNSDYASGAGTVTFSSGQSSKSVDVQITGDTTIEPSEQFFVNLSNAIAGATIINAQGKGTITDDDATVAPVEITLSRTSSWNGGFGGELKIKNNSGVQISGWTLVFDLTGAAFTGVWSYKHTVSASTYTITPESWNSNILNGSSISSGIGGTGSLTLSSVSNATFNGQPVTVIIDLTAGGGSGSGGTTTSAIDIKKNGTSIDVNTGTTGQETQFTMDNGSGATNTLFSAEALNATAYSVTTNNPNLFSTLSISASGVLSIACSNTNGGRAGLKITATLSSSTISRYIGVRVKNSAGQNPGMPEYVSMGSVSEDSVPDLDFWRDFQPVTTGTTTSKNKRIDIRYIYLNNGPAANGWYTWAGGDGLRCRKYIRESRMLGIIPFFVYYNIPDGGESYTGNLLHMESSIYMKAYFIDLHRSLEICDEESADDLVGYIFEPDSLGYMAQSGHTATDRPIEVNAAYLPDATNSNYKVLDTARGDPPFLNNLRGLVEAINYITDQHSQIYFGWQMNLWATQSGLMGGRGMMHHTDTASSPADFLVRRAEIRAEAVNMTNWYVAAGIKTHNADFVSIDKYGLDAGQEGKASDPASTFWFWNADQWGNYLEFCDAMNQTTNLPVILWQLPVGRINSSQLSDPYNGGLFPNLSNVTKEYEDSSPSYFLGDVFIPGAGNRFNHFTENVGNDTGITSSGGTVTWVEHVTASKNVGIISILFGAGVGISTDGVGSPPTENYWWITKIQEYYKNPVMR